MPFDFCKVSIVKGGAMGLGLAVTGTVYWLFSFAAGVLQYRSYFL